MTEDPDRSRLRTAYRRASWRKTCRNLGRHPSGKLVTDSQEDSNRDYLAVVVRNYGTITRCPCDFSETKACKMKPIYFLHSILGGIDLQGEGQTKEKSLPLCSSFLLKVHSEFQLSI